MEETLKTTKKHFSRLGGMFILGTVIIYAVQMIPTYIVDAVKPEWLEDVNISLLLAVLPMYLVGMPALILLVKRIPAETVEKKDMKWWQFLLALFMCFGLVYSTNLLGNVFTMIISLLKGSAVQNAILDIATSISTILTILYMVICAPLMEEYVFRKLIVDRTVRYGEGTAVVVSGLMFGLFHGNLNQFVYAFALGCFLAFLYVKTGNLKITIAIHMLINFVGGVVSVKLLELIDLEGYMEIMESGMDMEAMTAYLSENALGWSLYMLFVFFVFAMMLTALILFIVCFATKKFTLEQGQVVIPKGRRFNTVIVNAGMLIYCIFWIAMIVLQLFA